MSVLQIFGLADMLLFFGVILAVLIWQWLSVNRSLRQDKLKQDAE